MKRAKTTCRCISFLFRATNPKSEQSSNFLFLMPKEKKPKQWVSRQERYVRNQCVSVCTRADAMQGILKILVDLPRRDLTRRFSRRRKVGFSAAPAVRVTISRNAVERCARLERVFLVLFLQRASVLTGSSRVKIGASRSSLGETFFWTRPMDCYRMTNSRYSVRYIPLYVDCHLLDLATRAYLVSWASTSNSVIFAGQRSGGQCKHLRAE